MSWGAERVALAVAGMLGFACVRAPTPQSVKSETEIARPSASVAPAAKDSVEARIDGDAISLNGARTASEELAAALSQAGSRELLSIQLAPGYAEDALIRLFDAGNRAGFSRISLELGGKTLTVATSSGGH